MKLFHFSNNATGFGASAYYLVGRNLELATVMNWKTNEDQVQGFGVAARYWGYKNTIIRGKINNAFELCLGLTYGVTPSTKRNFLFLVLFVHCFFL